MELVRYVWRKINRLSIRTKIIVVFLLIMGLFAHQMSFSTYHYLVRLQGEDKVRDYLTMANVWMKATTDSFSLRFSKLVQDPHLGLSAGSFTDLYAQTQEWPEGLKPDVLLFLDASGKFAFFATSQGLQQSSAGTADFSELQAFQAALQGTTISGFEVLPGEIIQELGLTELVRSGTGLTGRQNDRALAMAAAEPVLNGESVAGVLAVYRILNNKFNMVDWLKDNFGVNAEIYQDSGVISTNVVDEKGNRALGEILPGQVRQKVLDDGGDFLGRYFIAHDWFITAFEPLRDIQNKIIGALYVGIREAPLLERQEALYNEIRLTLLILAAIFILSLLWLYKSIVQPIRTLAESALHFSRGDFMWLPPRQPNRCWEIKNCQFEDCPVYERPYLRCWLSPKTDILEGESGGNPCLKCEVYGQSSGNEIDQLTDAFNFMAASIKEQTESLYNLTVELQSRTGELINQRDELEYQKEKLMTLNNQLRESMKALDDSQSMIYALAVAVETKDLYTRGHSERVAQYSVQLAKAIGRTQEELDLLEGAALLHDIGKIGISDSILRYPGPLSKEAFEQIKTHPSTGERICLSLKFAQEMLPIIKHHHEHYNGQGYPDGLAGEQIPVLARVVAIADAFDAMTSDRPYRPGMSVEKALKILENGAGSQWDPEMVRIFAGLIRTHQITINTTDPADH